MAHRPCDSNAVQAPLLTPLTDVPYTLYANFSFTNTPEADPTGMQDSLDDVAIFWDYENCSPPCSVPGYDVVNNIREIALAYGSVKLFKAYLELSEQSSSKSIGLRSELQSCGVSLTDCPHNGRKDVADKMMIVDMLTYAIDNPAPATIVLISGDRDFVYAVSVLRLRRYRVVLVAPNTAHASLKSQATTVLDWEIDIMRRTTIRPRTLETTHAASDENLQQRSPKRPSLSFGGPLPQSAPRSARRPSFKANTPLTPVTPLDVSNRVGIGSFFQGRHSRNTSTIAADESLPANAACRCGAGYETTNGLFPMGDDMTVGCTPILDILEVMQEYKDRQGAQSLMNRPSSETSIIRGPSPSATLLSSVKPSNQNSSQFSASMAPTHSPMKSEVIAKSYEQNQNSVTAHTHAVTELAVPQPATFPSPGIDPVLHPATGGPLSKLSDDLPPILSALTSQGETIQAVPETKSHGTTQLPVLNRLKQASSDPSTSSEESPPAEHIIVPSVFDPGSSVPLDGTAAIPPPTESALGWVPAHFHPLMQVLEELRLGGCEQPLRSSVALRLVHVAKDIYQGSGKGSFKAYSAAAVEAGIVTLGGVHGYAWISLSPEWHGKVPVTALRC
ncbi:DUF537-domain-containing protein [Lentinus tigrinus ALCF2SS1-7]|uniref:DUF537-domain-containing protein n=1 Tax=Lentinus tigrinus ALCF2SS1-7 TaxID=1328758 RepID=UPI001165D016|nr:DUF537-domain-containing protein [Lentinus tigrinus ALCF2SS1-7]